MKITKQQLKQIIKEELEVVLDEQISSLNEKSIYTPYKPKTILAIIFL